ncbi:MAG: DUF2520 domain-containing protein [Deltaproteobacteria bacterium]|nr:DUF2520 domain-containing protein [Deltaproteobacteria bacterium]
MSHTIFILGAGSVGGSLGLSLSFAGRRVTGVYSRSADRARGAAEAIGTVPYHGDLSRALIEAEVVIVAVPDPSIEEVAHEVTRRELCAAGQVWLHCSGLLGRAALAPLAGLVAGIGAFHPAMVFPPGRLTIVPAGVRFSVEGDEPALVAATRLAHDLHGVAVPVPREARPAYHAAMVLASNALLALLSEGGAVLRAAGVDESQIEPMILSLASGTLERANESGVDAALTGPVRRGDAAAVARHLGALAAFPETRELYRQAQLACLRLARRLAELDDKTLAALTEALRP